MRFNVRTIVRVFAIILGTSFLTFLFFGLLMAFFNAITLTKQELFVP